MRHAEDVIISLLLLLFILGMRISLIEVRMVFLIDVEPDCQNTEQHAVFLARVANIVKY